MRSDERSARDFATSSESAPPRPTFLATAEPDAATRRVARFAIALSALAFIAMAPFAGVHLLRLRAFIPSYEAALAIIDLVTAILLFSQFSILRRRSLLAVACAYAISATMVSAHALSFPGGAGETGLYGDNQTTAWLYVFWHTCFPLMIGVYAVMARSPRDLLPPSARTGRLIAAALVAVAGASAILIAIAAIGSRILPLLIVDGDYSPMVQMGVTPAVAVGCVVVMGLMWRRRRRSVMDTWLFVVLWVWICDISLSAVISSARYDLGWYGGRAFSLLAASFVLSALLFELDKLYARLASAIGELEARNAELIRSRDVLARVQRFEALGQLTGGIAHDFNNLLTAITGGLEMILRHPSDEARVMRLATNASKAADRGSQLIRRLMSFARKQNLRPEVLDTNATLREFAELAGNLPAARITIRLELGDVGTICVDETEFQAAFLNLVGNARDAMPDGGEVVVSTAIVALAAGDLADIDGTPGDYVQVSVIDGGTGMAPEIQARIFEPFFTTKAPGSGTGLGLSQVYGFVRSAGGQVAVTSAPGAGTTVCMRLPRSTTSHIKRQQTAEAPDRRPGGLSVLLVEDDSDVLIATRDRVEELGYVVVTAANGDEAYDLLSKGLVVDVVLSDIVMPGKLNGVQLAEAVRRIRPGQKLVLTSGYTGGALDQFHLPHGLLFLPKPYSQKDLADKLVAATAE